MSPIKVNSGNDKQALAMAGGTQAGTTSAATSTSATSLTNTGASWTTNQWAGKVIVAGSVYGVVISNTATVATIDRWYNPATPTGSAGSTPSATATYVVLGAAATVFYLALTANATAEAATDTTLTAEITTAGGGLIRQAAAYGHTTGAASYTLTGTWTANGSDSLPVTIAKVASFDCLTIGGVMLHEKLLTTTAVVSASGDQLTVTQTVST